jgi:hypothetical protein
MAVEERINRYLDAVEQISRARTSIENFLQFSSTHVFSFPLLDADGKIQN